jgi:hypothetical protein
MINNEVIRNCTKPFPAIQGLVNEHALGKITIKNVYQGWQGESINQIRDKHEDNPYSLRIGMPSTDKQLKNDAIYFILHYLSFNPLTKDVEMREIIPYRNTEKIYIGQSIDESTYKNFRLFVDGNIVTDDIYLKRHDTIKDIPLGQVIINLIDKVEKLQLEIAQLKRQTINNPIYTKQQ